MLVLMLMLQDHMGQGKHTLAMSQSHAQSKSVSPSNVGVAQLVEDDINLEGPPRRHKGINDAQNLACLDNEPSFHAASERSGGILLVRKASSKARASLDVLPQPSRAKSHSAHSGSRKPNPPKAKATHTLAPLPPLLCKPTIATTVAEEVDEQTTLHTVVQATNRGSAKEDKCLKPHGTHSVDATQPLTNPMLAKRLLEYSGSSNDRGRALPKAACMLRGFKGQDSLSSEDDSLKRVPSNVSRASLSSKGDSSSDRVDASYQLKAVSMGIHGSTSRRQIR